MSVLPAIMYRVQFRNTPSLVFDNGCFSTSEGLNITKVETKHGSTKLCSSCMKLLGILILEKLIHKSSSKFYGMRRGFRCGIYYR